jgi:DnaJ-class molecular chaperone
MSDSMRARILRDVAEPRIMVCEMCGGDGCIDAPYSGSDPSCPSCDGEGEIEVETEPCEQEDREPC